VPEATRQRKSIKLYEEITVNVKIVGIIGNHTAEKNQRVHIDIGGSMRSNRVAATVLRDGRQTRFAAAAGHYM